MKTEEEIDAEMLEEFPNEGNYFNAGYYEGYKKGYAAGKASNDQLMLDMDKQMKDTEKKYKRFITQYFKSIKVCYKCLAYVHCKRIAKELGFIDFKPLFQFATIKCGEVINTLISDDSQFNEKGELI